MKFIKKTWQKFYYSTFYQNIWEWWVYSNGDRKVLTVFSVLALCALTFIAQEMRIIDMSMKHRQEKINLEYHYNNRIDELNYQLRTGDKRTPQERARDRRLRMENELWERHFDRLERR